VKTRVFIAGGLFVALLAAGGSVAWFSAIRTLAPLDLSQAARGSPIVTDRNGVLLRAFTTQDGRWRLPVPTADVDPRFLKLLKSYEDRRFDVSIAASTGARSSAPRCNSFVGDTSSPAGRR
jgi:penicillin-binding protein 1C